MDKVRITPVKLQMGTKVLWFDPADIEVHKGDHVIVSTSRGTEYGTATADIMEVSQDLVGKLKSSLKPVKRIATEEDVARAADLQRQSDEALSTFKQLAAESNKDMHPVMVEFLFDGDKAVFYFEAEERIDFRDLVRKLASHFHVRVDMRQIGVRDGARMVGGLGHCGQELCCVRMGGEFSPVTIRMAKEQNLSLNQEKISGCCGRLMCCLRYEFDNYKEVNSRAPKHGAKVSVPDGTARVTEVNVPLERVTLSLEDGKTIRIPLAEMEIEGEGKRPNKVSEEVFKKYSEPDPFEMVESGNFEVASFTGTDKLADPKAARERNRAAERDRSGDGGRKPRRRRRSSGSGSVEKQGHQNRSQNEQGKQQKSQSNGGNGGGSSSRRRSRGGRSRSQGGQNKQTQQNAQNRSSSDSQNKQQRRPGQKSSGIRNADASSSASRPRDNASKGQANSHRKPRRRQHKSGGEASDAQQS